MKKCPYCKTFMNDDVTTCPNCLKDMSSLKPMPEVNLTSKKKESNRFIYGGVLTLGGILASLSQGINKKGYQVKYDEILEPLDMGMKIYCKHSKLFYDGYLAIHRKNFMLRKASGNSEEFGDKARVEDFIDHIIQSCETKKVATWSAVTGK